MSEEQRSFESCQSLRLPDGLELCYREQSPIATGESTGRRDSLASWTVESPRGHILLVHGLGEHSGRYHHLARFFAEHGFRVFAFDQRGHGRSPGKRGDAESLMQMLDDLHSVQARLLPDPQESPLFLYGHSFGGMLTLQALLRRESRERYRDWRGAVVTSPLVLPTRPPGRVLTFAGRAAARIWPTFTFKTRFDGRLLTQDPESLDEYRADQYCHGSVTARLAVQMLDAGEELLDLADTLEHPIQLHHGASDPITSCSASESFATRAGDACDMVVWEAQRHELHQEVRRHDFMSTVAQWITRRATDKASTSR